jgi:predicted transcriptional regulator YdeE
MKKQTMQLSKLNLIGLTIRTNNKDEMNPDTAKIGKLAGSYWHTQIANQIQHRTHPGVTYAVYTEYESDERGEYTYFIGEAVDSLDGQNLSQFKTITIPESKYQKFTTEPGSIPEVIISAWKKIWVMQKEALGGKRKYIADFEIYDQRAANPNQAVIDIYIGIEG